jgi:fibronectin type 3 domain-containing protein
MKTKRFFVFGLPAALLALGLVLAGCDNPSGGGRGPTNPSGSDLSTSWSQSEWQNWFDSHPAGDPSAASAMSTFTSENSAWIVNNSWWTVLYAAWVAGGSGGNVVTDFLLSGYVTAPVTGALPDTTPINKTQYLGTIAWQTAGGSPHSGSFAALTVYKAVVTLTAKSGYTFTGVGANSFSYNGLTTIAHAANSGVVVITFPATGVSGGGSEDDPLAPAIPANLVVTGRSSNSITLAWGSVSGASGYYVYRADNIYGSYEFIGSTSETYYTDEGYWLQPNTAYYYKTSAVNSYGASNQSSSISGTTLGDVVVDPLTPAIPTGLVVTDQSPSSITLAWDPVMGASSYYVYRADNMYGSYEFIESTPDKSYTNNWLPPNTAYYYKVSAVNAYGASEQSYSVPGKTLGDLVVDPLAPATPTGLMVTDRSSNSIALSWYPAQGANSYHVYRADSSYGSYDFIGSTFNTYYTDDWLSSNTAYHYQVSAVNAYGESGRSLSLSGTTLGGDEPGPTPPPAGAPAAPSGVTATAQSASSISVSWFSVPGANSYRVYRADSSYGYYEFMYSTSETSYTNEWLPSNTAYYYQVSAVNDSGEGNKSYFVSATTPFDAPANVTATAQSSSSITVSWSPVSGANSYSVYRAEGSDGYYSTITSVGGTSYTDDWLSSNTTYYYKVSAGYGDSSQSHFAVTTTFVDVPTYVTAAAQSPDSISISWVSVSGASGYRVYRASSSYGDYVNIDSTSGVSYTDTGLFSSTNYYYKVSAYNIVGEGGQSYYTSATTSVSVPTGVTATVQSSSSISVSWYPVERASGYHIYRAGSVDGYYSYLTNTSGVSYTDLGLFPNTAYYYKVSAYNTVAEGAQSSSATATTPPILGTLTIAVGFNLDVVITGSDGVNRIRQTTGSPSSLALSATGYTGVVWYVDGDTSAPVSGDTITIDATDYTTKLHSVTFTGYRNGTPYAQVIPFTVLY